MSRFPIEKVILSDDEKKLILEAIASFYTDVRDENIDIIEQHQVLDLFLEEMAPIVYNKALDDAKQWYSRQMQNAESDYYMLYKER